jgi:hypothetical protein
MNLKRIKPGHITNCTFCKQVGQKAQAVWRVTHNTTTACEQHKPDLERFMAQWNKAQNRDYSEADHQTWLRL